MMYLLKLDSGCLSKLGLKDKYLKKMKETSNVGVKYKVDKMLKLIESTQTAY